MKQKLLNICLIVTSLLGYLEWGGGNSMFLFQGEIDILSRLFHDPLSAAHPFTLLPLLGQIILLVTFFQKNPSKILTFIGLGCLSVLLLFMFLIGVLSLNFKILLSTIPFIVTGIVVIIDSRRK